MLLVVAGVRVALLSPRSVELGRSSRHPRAPRSSLVLQYLTMIGVVVPFNAKLERTVVPDEDWLAVDAIVIPLVALGVLVLLTWGRRLLACWCC